MKNSRLFQIIDFDRVNKYENLREKVRKSGFMAFGDEYGFGGVYLERCNKESKSHDEIDKEVYIEIVALDTRLGLPPTDQLYWCLRYTTRSDIIKVTKINFSVETKPENCKVVENFIRPALMKVTNYRKITKIGSCTRDFV